ncbi:MAG TPA: hypothetical protein VFU35_04235, partial [Jatrophihabitans sp.]|nr:hypothetical protein [Jatrophihabitans sp.]
GAALDPALAAVTVGEVIAAAHLALGAARRDTGEDSDRAHRCHELLAALGGTDNTSPRGESVAKRDAAQNAPIPRATEHWRAKGRRPPA